MQTSVKGASPRQRKASHHSGWSCAKLSFFGTRGVCQSLSTRCQGWLLAALWQSCTGHHTGHWTGGVCGMWAAAGPHTNPSGSHRALSLEHLMLNPEASTRVRKALMWVINQSIVLINQKRNKLSKTVSSRFGNHDRCWRLSVLDGVALPPQEQLPGFLAAPGSPGETFAPLAATLKSIRPNCSGPGLGDIKTCPLQHAVPGADPEDGLDTAICAEFGSSGGPWNSARKLGFHGDLVWY